MPRHAARGIKQGQAGGFSWRSVPAEERPIGGVPFIKTQPSAIKQPPPRRAAERTQAHIGPEATAAPAAVAGSEE